ncbi:MAG TPA: VCBS repeat domain-containing M23 family metallopeptidase [Nocardioides sp.]|nr:VCBS repeat domain-containing M23 family metallopeptidase [Nocardioides sp.]
MGVRRRMPGLRVAVAATGVATLVVLGGAPPAHAAPENVYQMPFPCGQAWTGTTRASHSPSSRAVDWNRPDDLGDPVVASASGTVSVASYGSSGYGNWVRVNHANGESTIYAHLQSLAVKVGQTVDQGSLLGALGTSGNSTGPHLHFEERNSQGVMFPWFDGKSFVFGTTPTSRNCVDVPLAGNFIVGAAAELAVYRRAAVSEFRIRRPGEEPKVVRFGTASDQPVPGDWDGNGRLNLGVRTPSTRTFHLRTGAGRVDIVYGWVSDSPVAGDWDGDGRTEIGVWRASAAKFLLRAADGTTSAAYLGNRDDLPVTGDWNGDGATDVGVFDQGTATFTLRIVDADGLAWTAQVPFGDSNDLPVTADWDGNGKTDVGVWDPSTGTFVQRRAPRPTAARATAVTHVRYGRPR